MSTTMQAIRTPQNKAEPIIDKTPQTPFLSPLQTYIDNNCQHCEWYHTKCRLEDSRGLTPMSLCIALYTHQVPAEFGEILRLGKAPKAAALKELQEAEPEQTLSQSELFLKERAREAKEAERHDDA